MAILLRILRTTGHGLIRNAMMNLTAVLIISLLFLLLNALVFTQLVQTAAIATVERQLDVAVSFTTDVEQFQITTIERELKRAFPTIRDITFVSSDRAFATFIADFGAVNRDLATWLEDNTTKSPLPSTLVIAADPALHQPIIDWLTRSRYAKLLDLGSASSSQLAATSTAKILGLSRTLDRIAIATGIAFSLLATLIIVAVVRLAIFSRGSEITIMRLVGATSAYIRLPFIFEGIFFAVIASLVGIGSFTIALTQLDPTTFSSGFFGTIGTLITSAIGTYSAHLPLIIGWQLLIAIVVGLIASIIATYRYLTRETLIG